MMWHPFCLADLVELVSLWKPSCIVPCVPLPHFSAGTSGRPAVFSQLPGSHLWVPGLAREKGAGIAARSDFFGLYLKQGFHRSFTEYFLP